MISILAGEKDAGIRIDRLLRKRLPLLSLSAIYALIRRGGVRIDGRGAVAQGYRLAAGDRIAVDADPSELAAGKQCTIDTGFINTAFFKRNFSILHEDRDLIVCNKPAGLVVHPGSGHLRHDTLIDCALAYLKAGGKIQDEDDVALVHRLDRDTSGVILIAKNKPALRRLHDDFRDRSLTKQYVAICHGRPPQDEGDITLPLRRGRDRRGETTMRVEEGPDSSFSRSHYRLDGYTGDVSKVAVFLETGRTHQIRIHLSHAGAPILGDTRYGNGRLDAAFFRSRPQLPARLYLHSWKITVAHPSNGRLLTATAPLPREFVAALAPKKGTAPR